MCSTSLYQQCMSYFANASLQWTDLAGEAIERNSNEAAQFFTQYGVS